MSKNTPLESLHNEWGGKMTDFAGYRLPLSYAGGGFIAEHLHTRQKASLFDVSHMGQFVVKGKGAAEALSRFLPVDAAAIPIYGCKYSFFTNVRGGVLDDCIIAREDDDDEVFTIVVNGSRKDVIWQYVRENIGDLAGRRVMISELLPFALVALQGPRAEAAAASVIPIVDEIDFMHSHNLTNRNLGITMRIARCGYTGEDGFEFSLPADAAESFVRQLAAHSDVQPAGLGARDSLRLEAGLCLYGNELNEQITPVQAGLTWAIPKRLREGGEYPGAQIIAAEIRDKPKKRLVGLVAEGRKVARTGAVLQDGDSDNAQVIGEVSSGVFSPTLQKPIAMGFVAAEFAAAGNEVFAQVRGEHIAYRTAKLPFVPHQYKKGDNQ